MCFEALGIGNAESAGTVAMTNPLLSSSSLSVSLVLRSFLLPFSSSSNPFNGWICRENGEERSVNSSLLNNPNFKTQNQIDELNETHEWFGFDCTSARKLEGNGNFHEEDFEVGLG
ncbi:hypothetical protein LOK49_LG04G02681 [Camellia lanceoleosa]|uniref:Uncharacterized protein n=1 Tax=Camellia lanceoleosa TaxID=1840588 RepID=A0ACC0HW06_9ERIC|nr:hypothetical protein LOK49_LG04G02681 [Camellia lanceoleosa]